MNPAEVRRPFSVPAWIVVTTFCSALWFALAQCLGQSPPVIIHQPADTTAAAGTNVALSVEVAGPGPFTYQWRFSGTNLPNGIITTFAGNGGIGFTGDGLQATNASLYPSDVSLDDAGNVFISDRNNNRVRKIGPDGIISTVAGNGLEGKLNPNGSIDESGDDGPATNATVTLPSGLRVDHSGNLFVCEDQARSLRKVDADGFISSMARNLYPGPSFLALGLGGDLFVSNGEWIWRLTASGANFPVVKSSYLPCYLTPDGPTTNICLGGIAGLASDDFGNLFIADTGYANNLPSQVYRMSADGVFTRIAGSASAGFGGDGGPAIDARLNGPSGIGVDRSGNVFISDTFNNRIRKVGADGIMSTVAGSGASGFSGDGGPALEASLSEPRSIAVDKSGDLLVVDSNNRRVRKIAFVGAPKLTLSQVGFEKQGDYEVIVSNAFGSVTSRVAILTVDTPPTIVSAPASLKIPAGSNATFSGTAVGSLPLTYQWQFNGTNLVGANSSSLTISGARFLDSGAYRLTVSNAFGGAVSSAAYLDVGLQPFTMTPRDESKTLQFEFQGGPGTFYTLETAASLLPPAAWAPIVTNAADPSGRWTFIATNVFTTPARFYRLVLQ